MGRSPCCDKANVRRGPWSTEEDATLINYIQTNGTGGNWISLPHRAGLKRCGKSCRLRWLNYLRPDIKHGGFTEEEDNIICALYLSIGRRWSVIASKLPGRTDNDIKNYWNSKLKKRFFADQFGSLRSNATFGSSKTGNDLPEFSVPNPGNKNHGILPPLVDMSSYQKHYCPNRQCLFSDSTQFEVPKIGSSEFSSFQSSLPSSSEVVSGFSSWSVVNGSMISHEDEVLDFGSEFSYYEHMNGFSNFQESLME